MSYRTWFNVIRKSDQREVFSEQVIGNNAEFSDESWAMLNLTKEKGDVMDEDGCYTVPIEPRALGEAIAQHYRELIKQCYEQKHDTATGTKTYGLLVREQLQDSKSMYYRIPSWTVLGGYPAMKSMLDTVIKLCPPEEYEYTLSAG